MYTAVAGQGATLNDTSIRVDESRHDRDMLVGIPSSKDRFTVDVLREWVGKRGVICRNLGSTALHLGLVASGALAAAFCKRSKIWDVAAGALLVVEAGGRITDVTGFDLTRFDLTTEPDADIPFLAAAPGSHERLLPSVRAAASLS
jgi:myo-inositol-1(or 4)-monophosphatase